jgi:hypothetical protein
MTLMKATSATALTSDTILPRNFLYRLGQGRTNTQSDGRLRTYSLMRSMRCQPSGTKLDAARDRALHRSRSRSRSKVALARRNTRKI